MKIRALDIDPDLCRFDRPPRSPIKVSHPRLHTCQCCASAFHPVRLEMICPSCSSHMTPIELDTLLLVAEGLTNKEICRRQGVVEGTVKANINHLLRRLGINKTIHNNRVMMTRWAYENLPREMTRDEIFHYYCVMRRGHESQYKDKGGDLFSVLSIDALYHHPVRGASSRQNGHARAC